MSRRTAGTLLLIGAVLGSVWAVVNLLGGETVIGMLWVALSVSWATSGIINRRAPDAPRPEKPPLVGMLLLIAGLAVTAAVLLVALFG